MNDPILACHGCRNSGSDHDDNSPDNTKLKLFSGSNEHQFNALNYDTLRALAARMLDVPPGRSSVNSAIPTVLTYFGQFISHDLLPCGTGKVGRLTLDPVYAANAASRALLSDPSDRARMRLGEVVETGSLAPHLPDRFLDLPRAGQVEITRRPGAEKPVHALIADRRNDSNLFLAQLHVAFLRLHNAQVDVYPYCRTVGDGARVFEWARTQMTLIYQWLVLNVYLPSVCDPVVLREIFDRRAPLYRQLVREARLIPGELPVPLELSHAGMRVGHTMVRGSYDWNKMYGRGEAGVQERLSLSDLHRYTGHSPEPMPDGNGGSYAALPDFMVIDWRRHVHSFSLYPDRSARALNPYLAQPLHVLAGDWSLPARDLVAGLKAGLCSAQTMIESLNNDFGFDIPILSPDALGSGRAGEGLVEAGLTSETPVLLYILQEAELLQRGQRLGPLGTHIVGGSLIGSLINDEKSVINVPGSFEGRWHPMDGPRPRGVVVDSFAAMMGAARLM